MPVVCRSSALMLAALKPRSPQWKSPGVHAEEQPAEEAQHRVAEIAVQRRHGAGLDAAGEAIAHHQLGAVAQPRHERVERGEIVGVVGVAHDDEAAARRGDAAEQRCAVALARRPARRARPWRWRSAASRRCCHCRRSAPRRRCRSRRGSACAFWMQVASVSASLRQGIRMVSSIASGAAGWPTWAKRSVSWRFAWLLATAASLSVDESRHCGRQSLKKPMRWRRCLAAGISCN